MIKIVINFKLNRFSKANLSQHANQTHIHASKKDCTPDQEGYIPVGQIDCAAILSNCKPVTNKEN